MTRSRFLIATSPGSIDVYSGARVGAALPRWPPPTLAALAGVARAEGHDVFPFDAALYRDPAQAFAEAIELFRPTHIGLTASTPVFPAAARLAEIARNIKPEALRIVGGPHPSALPGRSLAESVFDAAVIGEGDDTLAELLQGGRGDLRHINGIAYRDKGEVLFTPARDKMIDLDRLPMPAWDLFNSKDYSCSPPTALRSPAIGVITGRGCLFNCTFCSKSVFGSGYRVRSPDKVMEEIKMLVDLGWREIHIIDDLFTSDLLRAKAIVTELGNLYRTGGGPTWNLAAGLHPAHTDSEFLELAADGGCHQVYLGFESGDQKNLNTLRKGAKVQQIAEASRKIRKVGLSLVIGAIFGVPGETVESMRITTEMAIKLNPNYAKVSLLTPYPGTALYQQLESAGRIRSHDWSRYAFQQLVDPDDPIWEHDTLDWRTIIEYYQLFYRRFYGRPGYIIARIAEAARRRQLLKYTSVALRTLGPPSFRRL